MVRVKNGVSRFLYRGAKKDVHGWPYQGLAGGSWHLDGPTTCRHPRRPSSLQDVYPQVLIRCSDSASRLLFVIRPPAYFGCSRKWSGTTSRALLQPRKYGQVVQAPPIFATVAPKAGS